MKTFSKDAFEFREARIISSNKEARIGVKGGLVGPDGIENGGHREFFCFLW